MALSGGLLQKNLLTTAENYRGHYSIPNGYNISQKFINSKASSFTNIYGPVRPGSRVFQTPASEMMNSIIDFHNDFMMVLIFVFVFTLTFISAAFYNYSTFNVSEFNAH